LPAEVQTTSDVLAFHLHYDVLGIALALVIGYLYGVKRLAADHAPRDEPAVTGRQQFYFFSGIALMIVVTTWPVHDIGEGSLFMFHMTEHMVLALAVPPLLLLGTPWWLTRLVVKPILPAVKILTRPLIALIAFNGTLALLHAPEVVRLMVTNEAFHLVAHVALVVTAFMMWWPVIGPIPDTPRLAPFPRIGYLFLQSLVPTVPASFLTLATGTVYGVYEGLPRLWGISIQTDQTSAGLIMKFGGGLIIWIAIAITFFSWFAEEERSTASSAAG
jgi:putative membrane protein